MRVCTFKFAESEATTSVPALVELDVSTFLFLTDKMLKESLMKLTTNISQMHSMKK